MCEKKRKLTVKQLSKSSGVSVRQIHRVEAAISAEFNTFEDYEIFIELRSLIVSKQYDNIANIINNYNIDALYESEFTMFSQILYYAQAIYTEHTTNNYKYSLNLCYLALNTTKDSFNFTKFNSYLFNELCYNILAQIEGYSFYLNDHETANKISSKLIDIIEVVYYDSSIPILNIPHLIFRTYIIMLNNKADSLFLDCNYENSLDFSLKAISVLNASKSNYLSQMIYFLTCENYYNLGDIENANYFLLKSIGACLANDKLDYITNNIKPKLETKYPLLKMPNF